MCDHCGCSRPVREVEIARDIMSKNDALAAENRRYFESRDILALNFVSSPGSGKTSLIERMIKDTGTELNYAVIEGDQRTELDAARIEATGAPVIQINTGDGCHLDAAMIGNALKQLETADNSILIIENVGNLICPSMFDLGESKRVILFSVTEGDDKPLKYPSMFFSSNICLINKIDLLPHVDFDLKTARKHAQAVNRNIEFFEVSAKTGAGMNGLYRWLKSERDRLRV